MTRLLTIIGAAGSGKTRLAVEAARDLAGVYPDGAWFVDLAPLSEPHLVPNAVAATLEIREQPGRPLGDTLADALRERDLLLVLDNCEHLLDPVATLVDVLLASCSGLRVLATSREPLGVEGELLWRVPPLSVPGPGHVLEVGELRGYESSRLFVQRARARTSAFAPSTEDAGAVAEICRHLEGLPLAIELAAARMGTMTAEQLARRLEGSLGLLSSGPRTASPRHRTMRATLRWSHGLLSEEERAAFRRLSVFAGGFTPEAAEAVLPGEGIEGAEVLELLSALVDKSLLVAEIRSGRALRYRMLEPIRQYAWERLQEGGGAGEVLRRHAMCYLELAEEAGPELLGEHREEWFRLLEREHANFRAALGWAFSHGEAELGLRLAVALYEFWDTHGHLSEGRGWLERGVSTGDATTAATMARALNGAGWMAVFQGDLERARWLVEESACLYRRLRDKEGLASAIANLGLVSVLSQRGLETVPDLLEEAVRLRSEIKDRRTIANLLIFEGQAIGSQLFGEERLAIHTESVAARFRDLHERALTLLREAGDTRVMGGCLVNLGLAELVLGNYERATELMRELLRLARKVDNKLHTQYAFFGLAGVAASQGRPARAARLWAASESVREAAGMQLPPQARGVADYEGRLAAVRAELGEEAFREAWAEGRAMALEGAVEYALSEEETLPTVPPAPGDHSRGKPSLTLTRREGEVAALVVRGLTNRQVASALSISERTVDNHVFNILKKLEVHSREQIAFRLADR